MAWPVSRSKKWNSLLSTARSRVRPGRAVVRGLTRAVQTLRPSPAASASASSSSLLTSAAIRSRNDSWWAAGAFTLNNRLASLPSSSVTSTVTFMVGCRSASPETKAASSKLDGRTPRMIVLSK
jgi:hypothetical protein